MNASTFRARPGIGYHVPRGPERQGPLSPVPAVARNGFREGSVRMSEDVMKTLGEIEAAVCEGVSRFEMEYMGRGPKAIHAHLLGDLLVVRLKGVLTAAEQQL